MSMDFQMSLRYWCRVWRLYLWVRGCYMMGLGSLRRRLLWTFGILCIYDRFRVICRFRNLLFSNQYYSPHIEAVYSHILWYQAVHILQLNKVYHKHHRYMPRMLDYMDGGYKVKQYIIWRYGCPNLLLNNGQLYRTMNNFNRI